MLVNAFVPGSALCGYCKLQRVRVVGNGNYSLQLRINRTCSDCTSSSTSRSTTCMNITGNHSSNYSSYDIPLKCQYRPHVYLSLNMPTLHVFSDMPYSYCFIDFSSPVLARARIFYKYHLLQLREFIEI